MEANVNGTLWQRFVGGFREPATLRLLVVAAAIAATAWISYTARAGLKPPAVEMPDRNYRNLPHELGGWHGVDKELDPEIFAAIGAEYVVDRVYRNGRHRVSLHLAVFKNPDEGILHSPMNCYRGIGYRNMSADRVSLDVAGRPDLQMMLTAWRKEQRGTLVGYWFKLGDHVLFDRTDMALVRVRLSGQQTWPALVKVMIHSDLAGSSPTQEEIERLRSFAVMVEKWLSAADDQAARKLIDAAASGAVEAAGTPSPSENTEARGGGEREAKDDRSGFSNEQ